MYDSTSRIQTKKQAAKKKVKIIQKLNNSCDNQTVFACKTNQKDLQFLKSEKMSKNEQMKSSRPIFVFFVIAWV